jgi:hypothetical protein
VAEEITVIRADGPELLRVLDEVTDVYLTVRDRALPPGRQ